MNAFTFEIHFLNIRKPQTEVYDIRVTLKTISMVRVAEITDDAVRQADRFHVIFDGSVSSDFFANPQSALDLSQCRELRIGRRVTGARSTVGTVGYVGVRTASDCINRYFMQSYTS